MPANAFLKSSLKFIPMGSCAVALMLAAMMTASRSPDIFPSSTNKLRDNFGTFWSQLKAECQVFSPPEGDASRFAAVARHGRHEPVFPDRTWGASGTRAGAPAPRCHPEAAEFSAERRTPYEGSVHWAGGSGAAGESIGPSARKKRGPQDDRVYAVEMSLTTVLPSRGVS